MVDWKAPQELMSEGVIFTKFMHALLGLYAWEFVTSLSFEWDFITGRKRFRWPLIFYFAGRYSLLVAMIGIAIALDTTHEIDCEALFTFNQLTGNAAVGLASINLSIRTMAVWSQNKYIIVLLILLILGHWSLILQGVLLKATWSTQLGGCIITQTNNTILAATFIYSMAFDLIVLTLNAYRLISSGLARPSIGTKSSLAANPATERGSRLGRLIFQDGLIFFFIAFLSNLVATVFMVLNLNQIMSVIFNVPAAVASTIVASRAVRRLTNFTNQGPEIYGTTHAHIRTAATMHQPLGGPGSETRSQAGVHVQMETFTRTEGNGTVKTSEDLGKGGTVVLSLRPNSGSTGDVEKGVAMSGWE